VQPLYEDKREKYSNKPLDKVVSILKDDGIDIAHQNIDILDYELCEGADIIMVLTEFDSSIESEFCIQGLHPVSYLEKKHYSKLKFHIFKDPYSVLKKDLEKIILEIKGFVKILKKSEI